MLGNGRSIECGPAELEHLIRVAEAVRLFGIGPATRIYLGIDGIDMRKGFDGLYGLVRDQLELSPRRFPEAEEIFQQANESRPGYVRPLTGLAETLYLQEKVDRALATVELEMKKSPGSTEHRRLYAAIASRVGKYDIAVEQMRKVVSADPSSIESRVQLSEAYRLEGDLSSAIEVLQQARQQAPNHPAPMLMLDYTEQMRGNSTKAEECYRAVLALQPKNAVTQQPSVPAGGRRTIRAT